ncbi:MAG: OsmC family protein [Gammaproteobacteria bacterium]
MAQSDIKKAVVQMVEAVTSEPKNGQFKYKVNTQWEGDVLCSANIRNFPALMIDEPAAFGGGDTGPSPVEVVLAALGTCQEIMYSALASVMDIELEECKVTLTGDLDVRGLLGMGADAGIPPGFTEISYETHIKSPADKSQLEALVAAVETQCPVLDMLLRNVKVSGNAYANGEKLSA